MFDLKNVDAQLTSVQLLTFKNLNEAAVDALLLQISLSLKSKIIKLEKMKIYKNQNKTKHEQWFRDAKIKMMGASKYFIINKVKILWCMQFLKNDSII